MKGDGMRGRCGRLVPAMTRCECVEVTFDELMRRMREQRASLDAVQAETGAGLLCTACLPDLRERLGDPDDLDEAAPGPPALAATHDTR
jgi:NAD(P)H-nitrite reductase large subunit